LQILYQNCVEHKNGVMMWSRLLFRLSPIFLQCFNPNFHLHFKVPIEATGRWSS